MNRPNRRFIIAVVGGAMDFCWLQAWTLFILSSIFQFRVHPGIVVFFYICSVVLNAMVYGKKRSRLAFLLIQLISFAAVFWSTLYLFIIRSSHLFSAAGFSGSIPGETRFAKWAFCCLLLLIGAVIWWASKAYVKQPADLERGYLRMDFSISAFIVLMLIKLIAYAKYHISLDYPRLMYLFIPMILFGFILIGILINSNQHQKNYASGFHKIGIMLSFATVLLLGGLGMISLFYSQFVASAEVVSGLIKKVGTPFGNLFVSLILFIFSGKQRQDASGGSGSNDNESVLKMMQMSKGEGLFYEILKWGLAVLMIIAACAFLIILLRLLLKYLLADVHIDIGNGFKWKLIVDRLKQWLTFWLSVFKKIPALFSSIQNGKDLYVRFIAWGRRSGIPAKMSETLTEYQIRISDMFPELSSETSVIVQLVHEEIYRGSALDTNQIAHGKTALKKMRRLVFWPKRFKTWLFADREGRFKKALKAP